MKHFPGFALFIVASLATAASAFGQGSSLNAKIPFNFTVGNTWMPAGEYMISSPAHLVIQLRTQDGKAMATVTSSANYQHSEGNGQLVFARYGDRYFLKKIVSPRITAMNVDVAPGKAEKRARTLEAGLQGGEQTLVAAR